LLGGYTAVMEKGEVLQYGPTAEVFHAPSSLRVARAFSDPPMNLLAGDADAGQLLLPGGLKLPLPSAMTSALGPLTLGVRAAALRTVARPGDVALAGKVELTEISGSDTYVHIHTASGDMVAQFTGVHHFALGDVLTVYLHPDHVYLFDAGGALLSAPERISSH
jgi:glycerol transport system ATP-binding protein